MKSLSLTRDDLLSAEYPVKKRINGVRFKLEERIRDFSRKDNSSSTYDAVASFFVVQHALYERLKADVNSATALIFATYVASKHSDDILSFSGNETSDLFSNERINFDAPYPDPVNALIEVYGIGLGTRSASLEAMTNNFFDWTKRYTLSTIENSYITLYTQIPEQEIHINGRIVKINYKEHKDSKNILRIRKVDLSKYETKQPERRKELDKGLNDGLGQTRVETIQTGKETYGKDALKQFDESDYIHGHDDVKQEISDMIFILTHKEWFLKRYPSNRILTNYLMIGPPGTGKTTLAKSLASKAGFYFIPIPCRELVSSYINDSAPLIRGHYEEVKRKVKTEGYNGGIIFLDEIDHLISARDDSEKGVARENNKVVNELNLCLEEYLGVPIITIGATNMDKLIDQAVRSRFQVVYVGYPETDEGITAVYNTIIKKIEEFRGEAVFDNIDFTKILEFAKTNERYKSGRTINNVLYTAVRKRDIEHLRDGRTSLVETSDVLYQLQRYDFNKEDDFQTGIKKVVRQLEVLAR